MLHYSKDLHKVVMSERCTVKLSSRVSYILSILSGYFGPQPKRASQACISVY